MTIPNILIIGAGSVGAFAAAVMARKQLGTIYLYDIVEDLAVGRGQGGRRLFQRRPGARKPASPSGPQVYVVRVAPQRSHRSTVTSRPRATSKRVVLSAAQRWWPLRQRVLPLWVSPGRGRRNVRISAMTWIPMLRKTGQV